MKKMLILLLVVLCLLPAAMGEAEHPVELSIELSQIVLDGPQTVDVTLTVTNRSGADMPGPLALYWPSGKIIEEFGTPTLLADESRTWEGTWFVTEEQLKQGRVIFAIQYTYLLSDGSIGRKTQPYYAVVQWIGQPTHSVEVMLKSNPTTGYDWSWSASPPYPILIERDYISDWQAEGEGTVMPTGTGGHTRVTMTGRSPGLATVTLTYARPWEENPPLYTLVYRVQVDEDLNVTILSSSFGW